MTIQTNASPSNKRVSELYSKIKATPPTLILQPPFQRKFVWSREHKEKFIETILKGLPFPEIYTAQSGIDLETISTQEVVVDGQQRLRTIVEYIDEPLDSREFGRTVTKYRLLSDQDRKDFLNYNVVVRDLGDVDSEKIVEIFRRINLTQYSLNQIEMHNAIYDGEFISLAKSIVDEIKRLKFIFFTAEFDTGRMADLYFILLILSTIENGGYFSYSKDIEKFIVLYNDEYEQAENVRRKMLHVFNYINSLELAVDSIWFRKSNVFTMIVELYTHFEEVLKKSGMKARLEGFETEILTNKNKERADNDFATYYSYMFVGTNSRQARVIRSELFRKYVLG